VKIKLLLIISLSVMLFACTKSPEDAKKELSDHGYSMESYSISSAVQKKDYDALSLFIVAGLDNELLNAGLDASITEKDVDGKAVKILMDSEMVKKWIAEKMKSELQKQVSERKPQRSFESRGEAEVRRRIEKLTGRRATRSVGEIVEAYMRKLVNIIISIDQQKKIAQEKAAKKTLAIMLDTGVIPDMGVMQASKRNLEMFKHLLPSVDGVWKKDEMWRVMTSEEHSLGYSYAMGGIIFVEPSYHLLEKKYGVMPVDVAKDLFHAYVERGEISNDDGEQGSVNDLIEMIGRSGYRPDSLIDKVVFYARKGHALAADKLLNLGSISKKQANEILVDLAKSSGNGYYSYSNYSNPKEGKYRALTKFVDSLVKLGADVNKPHGNPPLRLAIGYIGQLDSELVAVLLEHGANPNISVEHGDAFGLLFDRNYVSLNPDKSARQWKKNIESFINAGVKRPPSKKAIGYINTVLKMTGTLHDEKEKRLARQQVALDLVKLMKEKFNLNINGRDSNDLTPLMVASQQGFVDIAKWLVDEGANIHAIMHREDGYGAHTAVEMSVVYRHPEITTLLLDQQPIQARDLHSKILLLLAVSYGNTELATRLIDAGISPDLRDGGGNTLLIIAVGNKRNEMVDLLISKGAHVNAIQGKGLLGAPSFCQNCDSSPLRTAVSLAYFKMVTSLLKAGADVNLPDSATYRRPSIMELAWGNWLGSTSKPELVTELLKYGGNPNQVFVKQFQIGRHGGHYMLIAAVQSDKIDMTETLLAYGANPDIKYAPDWFPEQVHTVLEDAIETEDMDMVKLLLKYGTKVTRIHIQLARQKGYTDLVELLQNPPVPSKRVGWKQAEVIHVKSVRQDASTPAASPAQSFENRKLAAAPVPEIAHKVMSASQPDVLKSSGVTTKSVEGAVSGALSHAVNTKAKASPDHSQEPGHLSTVGDVNAVHRPAPARLASSHQVQKKKVAQHIIHKKSQPQRGKSDNSQRTRSHKVSHASAKRDGHVLDQGVRTLKALL